MVKIMWKTWGCLYKYHSNNKNMGSVSRYSNLCYQGLFTLYQKTQIRMTIFLSYSLLGKLAKFTLLIILRRPYHWGIVVMLVKAPNSLPKSHMLQIFHLMQMLTLTVDHWDHPVGSKILLHLYTKIFSFKCRHYGKAATPNINNIFLLGEPWL